jgi:hypothetical protein
VKRLLPFIAAVLVGALLFPVAQVQAQRSNAFSTKGWQEFAKALTDDVDFGVPRYTTALLPTCDTNSKGALAWDTTTNSLKGCNGTTWAAPFDGTLSSGQFLAPDGTANAPAYSFSNGTGDGIYHTGVNGNIWINNGSNFVGVPFSTVNGELHLGSGSDLKLLRAAAAVLQLGADVNGAAVAQTLKAHDGITGTDIAGANLTVAGGRGTGAGAPGNLIFQTATALGSGTTGQTLATRLTLSGSATDATATLGSTTTTGIITGPLTATGGADIALILRATADLGASDFALKVQDNAGTDLFTVSGTGLVYGPGGTGIVSPTLTTQDWISVPTTGRVDFAGQSRLKDGGNGKPKFTNNGETSAVSFQVTGTPTCSSNCGTSPSVTGSDTAGLVTMGATGVPASGWVVTFNGTWAAAPSCTVASALAGMVVGKMPIVVATTTTTMTVTTNGTAPANSDLYRYHCLGVQ